MLAEITDGVKVTVDCTYQSDFSNPTNFHFMFSYQIKIENMGEHTIQLLKRHWNIFDSCGTFREVDGDGVVGVQPILKQGESHEYVSGCNLRTELGKMDGFYTMIRLDNSKTFTVKIPEFQLICPFKLN